MRYVTRSMAIAACCAAILFACDTPQTSKLRSIDPPFTFSIGQNEFFEVVAEKGKTLQLPTGTRIHIPAEAFVDASGTVVKGRVTLQFKEYHGSAQIIASGIPMQYDSAGQAFQFQSAGMFEIHAYRGKAALASFFDLSQSEEKEEPLLIAPGKSIQVDLASFADSAAYPVYRFDEEAGNWAYLDSRMPQPNIAKQQQIEAEAPVPAKPIDPTRIDTQKPVFSIQADFSNSPEFKEFKGVMWQFAGEDPLQDPASPENQWVVKEKWGQVRVTPNPETENYTMELTTKNGKRFLTTVQPVLLGKDQQKAKQRFEEKWASYEQAIAKRAKAEELRAAEANLIRSFEVRRFGVYNHDIIYNMPEPVACSPTFQLPEGVGVEPSQLTLLLITGDNRVVVRYAPGTYQNFMFSKKEENKLIAVLPDNQIGFFGSDDFKKLNVQANATEKQQVLFNLQVKKGVDSMQALEQLIESL